MGNFLDDLGESEFENELDIDFSYIFLILSTFSLVTVIDYPVHIKTRLLH